MNAQQEVKLIQDVARLGAGFDHLDKSMVQLVDLQKETNHNVSTLALTVQEYKNVEERQTKLEQDTTSQFKTLGQRIKAVEDAKIASESADQVRRTHKQWWSDNWFKIVGTCVFLIPTISVIYNLVKGKAP